MVLPDLSWQFAYGRLAWALVLATLVCAAWPSAWRLPRRLLAAIATASLVLTLLPGDASAAWHLALAFQYPSGLLLGLCLVKLHARWNAAPAAPGLPVPLAALLAVAGSLLYLDGFGLLSRGYYYAGFGPTGAPLLAVLLAAACAIAIARGRARAQACAILGAVLLFSLARLPSGNLWDALLDPLLWAWSLASLLTAALRALRRCAAARRASNPAPELPAGDELPALSAAGAESFSPLKE